MQKILVRLGLATAVALGTAVVPVHSAGAAIANPIVVVWDTNSGGGTANQRAGTFSDGNGGTLGVTVTGAGALQSFPIVSMSTPSEYGTLSGTHDALAHSSQLQAFFEFTFAGTVSQANVVFRDIKAYQMASTPTGYTITAGVGETVSCGVETGLASTGVSNNVWTLHTSGIMSGKLLCTGSFTTLKFTPTGYTMGNVGPSVWWDRMTLVVGTNSIPTQYPQPTTPTTPVAPAYTG